MAKKKKKKRSAKKTFISILVFCIVLSIAAGVYIIMRYLTRTVLNENLSANGNTPGNLYNNGLFVQLDDTVYFSNPLDEGYLYVMNKDETSAKKLSSEVVYSLNAFGSYLYYSRNNLNDRNSSTILRGSLLGASRCDLDGKRVVTLNDTYTGSLVLVGNDIYFQKYENDHIKDSTSCTIHKIGIAGGKSEAFNENGIELACTVGTSIYYTGIGNDHNIYRMDTKTKSPSLLVTGNCWMPIVAGQDLFYIDLDNNYALMKAKLSNPSEAVTLVDERISTYNVTTTYVYFQIDDGSNSKLCRIRKDASANEYEVVAEGNYEQINVTSKYVYFNEFQQRLSTFRTPVNGPVHVQRFSDAVKIEK